MQAKQNTFSGPKRIRKFQKTRTWFQLLLWFNPKLSSPVSDAHWDSCNDSQILISGKRGLHFWFRYQFHCRFQIWFPILCPHSLSTDQLNQASQFCGLRICVFFRLGQFDCGDLQKYWRVVVSTERPMSYLVLKKRVSENSNLKISSGRIPPGVPKKAPALKNASPSQKLPSYGPNVHMLSNTTVNLYEQVIMCSTRALCKENVKSKEW